MRDEDVLIGGPVMSLITERLAERYRIHELHKAADPERLIAELAPRLRAMVATAFATCDARLIDRFPKLEVIANFGVGYDSVDARHAASRGILVTNTPDVLTEEVADTAFGLLLMTVRELSAAERHLRAGKWPSGAYPLTRATLRDRTMGIFGLGRIGKAIARRAEAFGVPVVYCGRSRQVDVPYRFYGDLEAMARDVDILMCVAPGGAETRHAVGTAVLDALGPKGILINVGRGSVVDEKALIAALAERRIFSAGLDVFENEPHVPAELIADERIVLLPHVGSASHHTRDRMGQLVVDNIVGWLERGEVLTPVAETPFRRKAG